MAEQRSANTGDTFKRIETTPGTYQCGCHWVRTQEYGDLLRQCAIHEAATVAMVHKFEREKAGG